MILSDSRIPEMMPVIRYLLPVILFSLLLFPEEMSAQITGCDRDPACVGNALTIEVTSGKGAQYVDVNQSSTIRNLSSALTFEAWIKPQEQPGKRQFVAGLWGPNQDNNDQWVVYIEGTRIVFELSADGTRMGAADNTIASADITDLYTRGWLHVAAVWDGSSTTARLIIDGYQLAQGNNTQYPLDKLHPIQNNNLPMQIGSCNALYDNQNRNRTFLGQMDEVRLWNRALTEQEIRCQRLESLRGNESGLILYYRCNENSNQQTLCDAAGKGNHGLMRSGAYCDVSDRENPTTYRISPTTSGGALKCTSDTTITFTLTDTSDCGSTVNLRMVGRDASLFTLSDASVALTQNTPTNITVGVQATISGDILAELQVANTDRCGDTLRVPMNFVRTTELSYSMGQIELDTLIVGCQEVTYAEDTLEICNTTGRNMAVNSAALDIGGQFSWRPADPARNLPLSLAPGECWKVIVRVTPADTTTAQYDTLRINSDDVCPGSGIVPVSGYSLDVFALLNGSGDGPAGPYDFGSVCPGQLSDVALFQYRNLGTDSLWLDAIIFSPSPEFFGSVLNGSLLLEPGSAYRADFIRFRPSAPGTVNGTLTLRARYRGCTIEKTADLTGYGINVDYTYDRNLIAFGNVVVGKSGQQTVTVTNNGDPRRISAYLKVGDAFRITGGRTFNLGTGESSNITVEFRPREAITYYDTLCVFDEGCYYVVCIPITGTGVLETLSFDPPYINMEDVVGCQCRTDTMHIKNISGAPAVISSVSLNGGNGKLTAAGAPAPGTTLAADEEFEYIITYCPDDLQDDRTDQAYIDVRLDDGQLYQILVRATSVVPRLYVEPLTTFGTVEVGWVRSERILVENISSVPIHITGVTLPPGYNLTGTTPALPVVLGPRDSLWVEATFAPTAEQSYNGRMTVSADTPCAIDYSGEFTGRGVVVRLDIPLSFINYGLLKPCDCEDREIPLPNQSQYIPITIDSVWIDGQNISNPDPTVFSWRSRLTGAQTLPYDIPPLGVDTLVVTFCPNIPAVDNRNQPNVVANAKIRIRARTPGWNAVDSVTLSGRRELNFQPNRSSVVFPATRVDVVSPNRTVRLTIPDVFENPSGDSVVITDVWFEPDDRVFSVVAANGDPLPWVLHRGDRFDLRLNFRPRAPKRYEARLHIRTTFPCDDVDTTVFVRGDGFAPAFGLQMAFDTANVGRDTLRLTTCDTLELPVMVDRDMPQDLIDILFRIGYDSSRLELLDVSSPFSTTSAVIADTGDGARAYLKDIRNVTAGTFALVRFVVKDGPAAFPITLDEIEFDSDSLVLFRIVPGTDEGWVIIDKPMIAVTQMTDFDTVNVRDCADRIIHVYNPGQIPVRFDSLSLPPGHAVTAGSVPYPVELAPGDSIELTVTFCAFREYLYDTTIAAHSNEPCPILDTGRIVSFGYAPPFPFTMSFDTEIGTVNEVSGIIGDTVEIPILVDRDIPQTPLDVNFQLEYNRRQLQYIDIASGYAPGASALETSTGLDVALPGCENIMQGELARLRFVFAVPDSITAPMHLLADSADFTSDSAFWVKPVPTGDTGMVRVDARCNITRLNFRGGANRLSAPRPNPADGRVTIEAEFVEDVPARLRIFDAAGAEVTRLIDGERILTGGSYRFEFNTDTFPSGVYFIHFEAGKFQATERMVVR